MLHPCNVFVCLILVFSQRNLNGNAYTPSGYSLLVKVDKKSVLIETLKRSAQKMFILTVVQIIIAHREKKAIVGEILFLLNQDGNT